MAGPTGRPDPELFRPTVTGTPAYDPAPWRPDSNFYVGFFGGIVPATIIAFLNARRLHAPEAARRVLVAGVAALALFALGAYLIGTNVEDAEAARRYSRLGVRAGGVLVHFLFLSWLKGPWRRFEIVRGSQPAPMWGPGFGAWLVGILVQAAVTVALMEQV